MPQLWKSFFPKKTTKEMDEQRLMSLMENFTRFCKQLFYYAHQGDFNESIRESATFKIIDESVDAILTAAQPKPN